MKDSNPFYSVLLFFVWPLLALVSAFRNYRQSWAKNILWAFIAFYGFTFAIGAENKGTDIVRYIEDYQQMHNTELTVSSAKKELTKSGDIDVIKTVISIVLSRFTDNQSILTLVYGIIFGFFFSRNMWFVLEHLEGRIKPITILLFLTFFLIIPIWNMNGFRFWTAAHVFIYGLLPFLFKDEKGKVVIAAAAVLIHFAFLVPVGILAVYIVAGNRLTIYFAFFLATFFISEIDLTAFNNIVETYAPESLQERTAGYRGEKYVENFRDGANVNNVAWYVEWNGRLLKWAVMGLLVLLFVKSKALLKKHRGWLSLYSFTLLFYGMANLLSSLPSGGRYIAVANMIAIGLFVLYLQNNEHNVLMKRITLATAPALLLFIVVSIRMGLYSTSAASVLGNPVIAIFFNGEHLSLNDVMRLIL